MVTKSQFDHRLMITVALLSLTSGACADVADDWKNGKIKPAAPEVTYSGPVQNLKFGHPAPPVSYGVSGYSGAGTMPSDRNDPDKLRDNLMPYALTGHMH